MQRRSWSIFIIYIVFFFEFLVFGDLIKHFQK
jgi:hypothetical protein